jgi:hypothetical protein
MTDSLSFVIKPAMANGKLAMVEVKDVASGETSAWTPSGWNGSMEVTPGTTNLQITAIVWNTANTSGKVTIVISISGSNLWTRETIHLAPGESFVATGVWDMPNSNVTVTITVTDTI